MKLLLVSLFWLSVVSAYGVYRFVKRDRTKFPPWFKGIIDGLLSRDPGNTSHIDGVAYCMYSDGRKIGESVAYHALLVVKIALGCATIGSFIWAFGI